MSRGKGGSIALPLLGMLVWKAPGRVERRMPVVSMALDLVLVDGDAPDPIVERCWPASILKDARSGQ